MRRRLALALGSAAATGAAIGLRQTLDQWAAETDPVGGDTLADLDGRPVAVTAGDGAELRGVVIDGTGPTVVLVHGFTGDREVWGAVAGRLVARGHRVVVVDLRGHGASSTGHDGFTPAALADDLATWLTDLGLDAVTLVGQSMGGFAIEALLLHRRAVVDERVAALVFVSSGVRTAPQRDLALRIGRATASSSVAESLLRRPRLGLLTLRSIAGDRPVLAHLERVRDNFLSTPAETRAAAVTMMQSTSFDDALTELQLRIPGRVIVGEHDGLLRVDGTPEPAIPELPLTVIEGAGHLLPWEVPERLTSLIAAARG